MDLAAIRIGRIKKSDIHCDIKSFEDDTNRTRKKYKVFSSRIFESLIFFKFTTELSSCDYPCTLFVKKRDFKRKKSEHLNAEISYVDASKPDILSVENIAKKINDVENRFEHVANLRRKKFKNLIYLLKISKKRSWRYSSNRTNLIDVALDSLAKERVEKLERQ